MNSSQKGIIPMKGYPSETSPEEIFIIILFLSTIGKNEPHILVLAGFLRPGWDKLGGKVLLNLMAFGDLSVRCKSAVFWQTERIYGVFSTGTEKEHNPEISEFVRYKRRKNGAQFGLISPLIPLSLIASFPVSTIQN